MRIFSESSYKEHIEQIKQKAWIDGFNAAGKIKEYEKDLEAGRITMNEYRQLKYNLPSHKVIFRR
jgi:hypothetical protein